MHWTLIGAETCPNEPLEISRGERVNETAFWIIGGGFAVVLLPILAFGFIERRARHRDSALGSRRKDRLRL